MKDRWIITVWAEGEHVAEHRFEGSRDDAIKEACERARAFEAESGRSATGEVEQAFRVFDSDANVVMDHAGYWTLPDAIAAAQVLVVHIWGTLDKAEGVTEYEVASVCSEGARYARVQAREANKILDDAGFPHARGARPLLIAEVTLTQLGLDHTDLYTDLMEAES